MRFSFSRPLLVKQWKCAIQIVKGAFVGTERVNPVGCALGPPKVGSGKLRNMELEEDSSVVVVVVTLATEKWS